MQEIEFLSLGQEDSPGEGNGNPLQYSCLENPMDGGAWWATVHGVTNSRTRLSDFTFYLSISNSTARKQSVCAGTSLPTQKNCVLYQIKKLTEAVLTNV